MQHSELTFDPRSEALNVAGYFRGDAHATLMVAAATHEDPDSWGERPSTISSIQPVERSPIPEALA